MDQQEAHEQTYAAAKATYNELAKLRSEVEPEVAALKGQAEGQGAAVTTLTEGITQALKLQWEVLNSKLQDDTQKIINAARTEFDIVKTDLGKLQDWTQRAIKQQQDDRVEACEINKDATETLSNKVQTLRRKIQDFSASMVEDLLPSPKRQRTSGQDLSHFFGPIDAPTSAPPPLPLFATDSTDKKEPRNLPLPANFNRTSTKLKEFLSKVESPFERMPQTYGTTNDKILFIADLLTDGAHTWYSANKFMRYPDPQSGYLEWDTYTRFKCEFITAHLNLHESREAKTELKKEFQRKGEAMKDFIAQVRVLQLVAYLTKE